MSESIKHIEVSPEKIPSNEEVESMFEKMLDGKEYTLLRKVEDDEGIYILDIQTVDDDGDRMDIIYQRAGKTENGGMIEISAIHQTLYTSEGIPCGAGTQAEYINGNWKVTF